FSWFDNVSVIRWDGWADYDVSQSIPTPNDYYFLQVKSSDNSEDVVVNYSEAAYESGTHIIEVDLTVYLEGPFNGTDMNTDLTNSTNLTNFPTNQPYTTVPWNYDGTESVVSIPNPDVVDWILVEFRDATDAASATEVTTIERQAAFLLRDGSVVGMDGPSQIQFIGTIIEQLFVVVRHRNHIDIMSANPLTETGGVYTYDFTTSIDQVYGENAGYKSIASGIYGMAGGDADAEGTIDGNDKIMWEIYGGAMGYLQPDLNFVGQVNNPDKDDVWILNTDTITSQVPE
ncbi:MAG: hypothetical protein K8S16_20950, partial [Bacteroidales bacterium]|nr:hypothetical protein [Bacteroidales bacterium]